MDQVKSSPIKIITAGAIPLFAIIVLLHLIPVQRWVLFELHSVLETLGLFAGLSVAILLLILFETSKEASRYVWISAGLTGMGILDGFHASVHVGNNFVWLHSTAVLVGGFLFAILLIAGNRPQKSNHIVIPVITAVLAVVFGIYSLVFPETVPRMLSAGLFTPLAISINFTGGILFILTSLYFLARYYNTLQNEEIFFALFCVLHGLAGLSFSISSVWDTEWWAWHIFRVWGNLMLLGFFFVTFRQTEAAIEERNRQLLDAQEELIRREKLAAIGKIASMVGHEVRNPLGVINNAVFYLSTVLEGADESVKEYLNIIREEIAVSERIVADLLDFARTKTPQKRTTSIQELIKHTLHRYPVPENIKVELSIPDALPEINIDPVQIGQVFINIIKNSVEMMPEGGTLIIKSGPQAPGFIEISFTDTGPGIPPDVAKKLFQPLFTTKAKGLGLGLTIVKNLTEANDGRVEVESEEGKGTTFKVVFKI